MWRWRSTTWRKDRKKEEMAGINQINGDTYGVTGSRFTHWRWSAHCSDSAQTTTHCRASTPSGFCSEVQVRIVQALCQDFSLPWLPLAHPVEQSMDMPPLSHRKLMPLLPNPTPSEPTSGPVSEVENYLCLPIVHSPLEHIKPFSRDCWRLHRSKYP